MRARLLGLLLVLAVGLVVAEAVVAAAWDGPTGYSWSEHVISELGRTDCGAGVVPTCSPRHAILNVTLVATGLRVLLALMLGWSLLRGGVAAALAAALVVVYGVGTAVVGVFPLQVVDRAAPTDAGVGHLIGAGMTIVGGVLALLALAWALSGRHPAAAALALVLGVLGLLAVGLGVTGTGPVGLTERAAVYAPILWQLVIGLALLLAPGRALPREGEARPAGSPSSA